MNTKLRIAAAVLMGAAITGWAQQPPPEGAPGQSQPCGLQQRGRPQGDMDMVGESFFPPEMVMQHQQILGLTDEQKAAIKEAMRQSVVAFTDLQWDQTSESEAMSALVKPERIDEAKALAQLNKLLGIESEIKRLRMTTLIKVKNILTPEQQAKLRGIKRTQPLPALSEPQGSGGRQHRQQGRGAPPVPPAEPPPAPAAPITAQ